MPQSKDSKSINQTRGPTVGNAGSPDKRAAFRAQKESFAAAAEEITSAVARRADSPTTPTLAREARQRGISPVTNKGPGPRRGNK